MGTRFFKIIVSTQPKLRIPQKFVREHENSLPTTVSLEPPYGPSWQCELIRCKGEIWLDRGFEQFMNYFSIGLGYLLLFRYYCEDLCFRVVIFDTSATEINYRVQHIVPNRLSPKSCPLKEQNEVSVDIASAALDDHGNCGRQNVGNRERVEEDDSSDVSIEILEEISTGKQAGGGEFRKAKKRRRGNEVENLRIEEKKAVGKEVSSRNRESKRNCNIRTKCETAQPDVFPSAKGKRKYDCSAEHNQLSYLENRAYERARAFVTTNPSFIVVMRHSHIVGCLNINNVFAEEMFKGQDTRDVVLCVPGCRRTWTAKVYFGLWKKVYWRQFVKDNGLCYGDVCVIELGNGTRLSLNVIIFRNNKNIEYGSGDDMEATALDNS